MRLLHAHDWPGNVRELRATVTALVLLCDGDVIRAADLAHRPELLGRAGPAATGRPGGGVTWDGRSTLGELQGMIARSAVAACDGNKSAAARALGIDRSTLYAILRRTSDRDDDAPELAARPPGPDGRS